jgi:hypothetical protein
LKFWFLVLVTLSTGGARTAPSAAAAVLPSYAASATAGNGFSAASVAPSATGLSPDRGFSSSVRGRSSLTGFRAPIIATAASSIGGSIGGGLNHRLRSAGGGAARAYNTSLRELAVSPRPVNFGIRIVPEKSTVVIERFGKFHAVLNAGRVVS